MNNKANKAFKISKNAFQKHEYLSVQQALPFQYVGPTS
jgi:hypothetical protein